MMRKRLSMHSRHSVLKLDDQNNDKLEEELHKLVKKLEEDFNNEIHSLYTEQAKFEHI